MGNCSVATALWGRGIRNPAGAIYLTAIYLSVIADRAISIMANRNIALSSSQKVVSGTVIFLSRADNGAYYHCVVFIVIMLSTIIVIATETFSL